MKRPLYHKNGKSADELRAKKYFASCKSCEGLIGYPHKHSRRPMAVEIDNASLQKCARKLVDFALEGAGHALVYHEFCAREPKLKHTPAEVFFREYASSKLALGCVYWVGCCASHGILDKELKNLFLKEAMNLFQTPESLGDATRFSESLYASYADAEQSPVLGVLVHLFHELGLEAVRKPREDEDGGMNAGFLFMMGVSDALKNVLEGRFDDFLYAHEAIRTTPKEGAK